MLIELADDELVVIRRAVINGAAVLEVVDRIGGVA
jgi:hypothetical protein